MRTQEREVPPRGHRHRATRVTTTSFLEPTKNRHSAENSATASTSDDVMESRRTGERLVFIDASLDARVVVLSVRASVIRYIPPPLAPRVRRARRDFAVEISFILRPSVSFFRVASSLVGPDVVFVLVRFPGSGPWREVAGVRDERGVRVREAHVEVAFAASDVAAVAPGEGRLRLEHLGRRARGIGGGGWRGGSARRVSVGPRRRETTAAPPPLLARDPGWRSRRSARGRSSARTPRRRTRGRSS